MYKKIRKNCLQQQPDLRCRSTKTGHLHKPIPYSVLQLYEALAF